MAPANPDSGDLPPPKPKKNKKQGPSSNEAVKEMRLIEMAKAARARRGKQEKDTELRQPERAPEPEEDPDVHLRAKDIDPEKTKDGFAKPLLVVPQKSRSAPSDVARDSSSSGKSPAQAIYGALKAPPPRKRSSSRSSSSSHGGGGQLPLKYDPPYWSALPDEEFGFDVIKNGTIVTNVAVHSKPFLVVGRHPQCDLVLQHPSVSRAHCIVQHREGGLVYLYEFGSTHGTKVNKEKLQRGEHTEIKVGDVIKFGESSRLYVLTGPEEYQRVAAERQLPEHIRNKIAQTRVQKLKERKKRDLAEQMAIAGDTSWGLDEDADVDSDDDPLDKFTPKTDRQKKLWERIEAKELKIANIKSEMAILTKKRSVQGELSEGQEHAMQRCDKRIGQLEEIIESIKDTLRDELDLAHRRSTGMSLKKRRKQRIKRRKELLDDDSDDEFYDRTIVQKSKLKTKKKKGSDDGGKGGANDDGIDDKTAVIRMTVRDLESALMHMRVEKLRLTKYLKGIEEGKKRSGKEDSLDAYMSTVDRGLKAESAVKFKAQLDRLESKMNHYKTALTFKKKQGAGGKGGGGGGGGGGGVSAKQQQQEEQQRRRRSRLSIKAPEKKVDDGDESEEEDYRMNRPSKSTSPATGRPSTSSSVGAVLKRVTKMKKKIEDKIEEKRAVEHAALVGPENDPKKPNKKKRKKNQRVKSAKEDEDEEKGDQKSKGDGDGDDQDNAPKPVDNDTLRSKYKEIFEKMRRDEENQKSLYRLPGVEEAEQQVGLILRKKKKRKKTQSDGDDEDGGGATNKIPRRSKIGPAVVPPPTVSEDQAQWQDTAWQPPKGQTGDGRTHLNDKYGY